ncbi:MAG: 3'-5' exonuclease [Bacteroidales bacterium]|nr:3'-5' exonuclease [Bacteroidales bacterium]
MDLNLSKPIVFFDLESTGSNAIKDRIVEISMLKVHTDGKEEIMTQRINPQIPVSEEAEKIHGLSNEMLKKEPTFAEVSNQILSFIGSSDLAGYNLMKFDIPMLVEEFLRNDIDFDVKNRRIVDVQNIFHKMEQRTLKAAYKFYCGKNLDNAHSAEADTVATYEILKSMLDKYQQTDFEDKDGTVSQPVVNDMDSLDRFSKYHRNADLMGQIVYNENDKEVFNFGKYKGKLVEDVFRNEPQYYDWMMKADFPNSTKKLITAIKLRGFNKDSVNIG